MKYIGKINSIVKPTVKANGVNIVAAKITNRVGEIPTCSLSVLPEDVEAFDDIDKLVTVQISGTGGSGMIFAGYPTGLSCSNMSGSVSAGVDLVHTARDLDETSSLVPGIVPASNADVNTFLYHPKGLVQGVGGSLNVKFPVHEKEFGPAICEGMIAFLKRTNISSSPDFIPSAAGEKGKAIGMLEAIGAASEKTSGKLKGVDASAASWIESYCTGMLSRGGNSATIWDVLSMIVAAFDSCLICKPDGSVVISPNFNGVKAGKNTISPEILQKFDRSCVSTRSPQECRIVGDVQSSLVGNLFKPATIGTAVSPYPGSRGTMVMSCPGWLSNMMTITDEQRAKKKQLMDNYALSVIMRYSQENQTFSLVCPVCPEVFPGTCATFKPASSIKSFDGGKIGAFEKKYDGYCYQIEHYLSSSTFCTSFMFKTALEAGKYPKQSSHPLFESAKMMEWT